MTVVPGATDLLLTDYADAERDRIVETLFAWLRIPSISADPSHGGDVRASADFAAGLLTEAGFDHVQVLETGTPDAPGLPAVYGDWLHAGPDAPTVLVYGHHDVQPVDPVEDWVSPPFTPVVVDGECKARGAIDDKGQILYEIEAARGLLRRDGRLPVNLKVLVEGEEEVGSPNFEALLRSGGELLACDVIVVSDTGMIGPDVPSATVSMRGLVAFDVELATASRDLHSGMWGGTVPNAALAAARLVATLHDADNRVTLPRFYDRVRPLSAAEQASLDAQPFDEASFRADAADVRALPGEAGYTPVERIGVRPTAEVVGIHSGYGGPGIKTIVPARAGFKVALRLVPDQRPDEITEAFGEWLAAHLPEGVDAVVTPEGGVAPALTPVDHPAVGALARAIERVWGAAPLWTREGGSGPEEALGRVLAAPVLFLGVGLPDDRIHAPNERMVMAQFWKGLLAAGELLHELARVPLLSTAAPHDVVPDDAHEWVSFEDPDEARTWLFDVTFLLSPWTCIFGRGCQGVLTGPTPELVQGCCSYGAHFTDDADVSRVRAAARCLTAEQWQHRGKARRGLITTEPDGTRVTRLVDDACIFLNRPGFPGGAGCALHRAALESGCDPLETKPDVCWQLPLRRSDAVADDGHVTSTVAQWDRRHWGEGGSEFHWWCTESPDAFVGATPVYRSMAGELRAMAGPAVHDILTAYLDRRTGASVALPHPALRVD